MEPLLEGIDEAAIWAEIAVEMRAEDRRQWIKGFRALWGPRPIPPASGFEVDWYPLPKRWLLKAACTLAMLLNRQPIREAGPGPFRPHNSVEMAWWDYVNDGYFWSSQQLNFHLLQFRFDIIKDGECLY